MNTNTPPQVQRRLAILLFAICAWGIADIVLDSPNELKPMHLASEIALLLTSMAGGLWLWRSWRQSLRDLDLTRKSLAESNQAQEEWRRRMAFFTDGFHAAIEEQFTDWQLTPTEREVAKYLLRGFSHKDIARFSERSERTVRQHSVAVYRKAKLAGRAELSAFFLEGLLPADVSAKANE
jgi:DNA-binding NarL/FixJ family response regulator